MIRPWLILPLVLFAGGCAFFRYDVSPDEPHAILKFLPNELVSDQYLTIYKVDGKRIYAKHSSQKKIRVQPGRHVLTFKKVTADYKKIDHSLGELVAGMAGFLGADVGYTSAPDEPVPEYNTEFMDEEINVEAGEIYTFDPYGVMTTK